MPQGGNRPSENANSLALSINFKDRGGGVRGSPGGASGEGVDSQKTQTLWLKVDILRIWGGSGGVLRGASGRGLTLENANSLACFIHFNDRGDQGSPRGASGRGGRPERHTVSHIWLRFFSFVAFVILSFLFSFWFLYV